MSHKANYYAKLAILAGDSIRILKKIPNGEKG